MRIGVLCAAVLATILAASSQSAKAADDFYKGKQIRLIVGSDAGGGYDAYARLLARFWPDHIPGNPTFIVQNMPGASSLTAINYVANNVPKDGTVIAGVQNQIGYEPMLGLSGTPNAVHFDPLKMPWLGSATKEVALVIVMSDTKFKTLKDVQADPITTGSAGIATSNSIYANVMNATAGTKFNVVTGYKGQNEIYIAMERGEVQGTAGVFYSSFMSSRGDWLTNGKARILAQIALEKHPTMPDIPLILDFAKSKEDRQEMELAFGSLVMGRPFVAPEGVPADRIALLRDSFVKTLADPVVQKEAAKEKLEINVMSGEAIQKLLQEQYKTPQPIIDKVHQLMMAGGN
jgi:tripartite-type tricarboxylate transporter receptor subunit TctC